MLQHSLNGASSAPPKVKTTSPLDELKKRQDRNEKFRTFTMFTFSIIGKRLVTVLSFRSHKLNHCIARMATERIPESGEERQAASGAFYGSQGETWITHPMVKPTVQDQFDMKGKVRENWIRMMVPHGQVRNVGTCTIHWCAMCRNVACGRNDPMKNVLDVHGITCYN